MNSDLRDQLQASLGDHYTLGRELPRGGMSRVFAATERALGRTVVIKVLSPELAVTLSAERFKREIQLAARLQHPHIVPLLNAGAAAESLYFTMPLVEGESLRDRMSRERPMAIDNVIRILAEVAGALEYAHGQGVVHRDMKPENVMFFHDSAVVLDFGIGKALTAASDDNIRASGARITQTGMSLGTPLYISPEQAAGDPELDHRADIYSLGVVAYEMITGHPPFSGRTPQVIFAAHAHEAPVPLTQYRRDAPSHLVKIVMKCLEKQPKNRPQSAAEIVRVLRGTPAAGTSAVNGPLGRIPGWIPWALAGVATALALVYALRLARIV
jgi:serine/threonine-protein kinase